MQPKRGGQLTVSVVQRLGYWAQDLVDALRCWPVTNVRTIIPEADRTLKDGLSWGASCKPYRDVTLFLQIIVERNQRGRFIVEARFTALMDSMPWLPEDSEAARYHLAPEDRTFRSHTVDAANLESAICNAMQEPLILECRDWLLNSKCFVSLPDFREIGR